QVGRRVRAAGGREHAAVALVALLADRYGVRAVRQSLDEQLAAVVRQSAHLPIHADRTAGQAAPDEYFTRFVARRGCGRGRVLRPGGWPGRPRPPRRWGRGRATVRSSAVLLPRVRHGAA